MFIQSSWLCVNNTSIKLCKKQKQTYVCLLLISVPRFHSTRAFELLGIINWLAYRKLWSLSFLHGNIFRDCRQPPNHACSLTQELVQPRLTYPFSQQCQREEAGAETICHARQLAISKHLTPGLVLSMYMNMKWTEWNHNVLNHGYCIYS